MRVIVNGSNGRMGKEVIRMIQEGYPGNEVVAGVDINNSAAEKFPIYENIEDFVGEADCIIDFSHHSVTKRLMDFAVERKIPVVVATTGHTDEELDMINEASKSVPVFRSANMSVGIALLVNLAKTAAKAFPNADIEIIEKHHNRKLDVPSGTALMLADAVKEARPDCEYVIGRHENGKRNPKELGIHSLRLGNVIGEHEVIIATDTQVITLKHEAQSRSLFAEGAIVAAEFLSKCKENRIYNMDDMLKGDNNDL